MSETCEELEMIEDLKGIDRTIRILKEKKIELHKELLGKK